MSNFIATVSKINCFETCPRKFWLLYGSKYINGKPIIPFQTSKALDEGSKKHELMEAMLKERGTLLPGWVTKNPFFEDWWLRIVIRFVTSYKENFVEKKIGLSKDWAAWAMRDYYKPPPEYRQAGSPELLMQSALDAVFLEGNYAIIVDWKSGRVRKEDDWGQLAACALLAFCFWSKLETIDSTFIFLDHRVHDTKRFTRFEHFEPLKEHFLNKIKPINNTFQRLSEVSPEVAFYADPGNCYWCPAENSHCKHSRK